MVSRAILLLGTALLAVLPLVASEGGSPAPTPKCTPATTGFESRVIEGLASKAPALRTTSAPPATRIPNIVHFVFGLRDAWAPFGFLNYASVMSAVFVQRADQVILHYYFLPQGVFWDLVSPYVTLRRVEWVDEVFGRPVVNYAHKADVVRMEALLEFGGIYLDIDVVVLRPFDHLLGHEFVMGQEGERGGIGLCNAVMLASKDSRFLRRWFQEYKSFNGSDWNFHSVRLPQVLARAHPEEIVVLNHTTFFWPLWTVEGLGLMYRSYAYEYKNNLAIHLWNSAKQNKMFLDGLSMQWTFECRSSLLSHLQVYVPPAFVTFSVQCRPDRLNATLESLRTQSFRSWEVLVIDDEPNAQCETSVRAWVEAAQLPANRVRVLRKETPEGAGMAHNWAVDHARGLFVVPLEPGDQVPPDFLMRIQEQLSDARVELFLLVNERSTPSDVDQNLRHPSQGSFYAVHTRAWRRSGGFSTDVPPGADEYDFWLKLLVAGARPRRVTSRFADRAVRTRPELAPDLIAMVRMVHASLFPVASRLDVLGFLSTEMRGPVQESLEKERHDPMSTPETRFRACFWLLPRLLHLSDLTKARECADALSKQLAWSSEDAYVKWQVKLLLAKLLCLEGHVVEGRRALEAVVDQVPEARGVIQMERELQQCVPTEPRRSLDFLLQSPKA